MFAKELLKRKLIKPGDKVIALSGLRSKNGKWNMDSITVRTVPKQK
jgi:hypothetical protein